MTKRKRTVNPSLIVRAVRDILQLENISIANIEDGHYKQLAKRFKIPQNDIKLVIATMDSVGAGNAESTSSKATESHTGNESKVELLGSDHNRSTQEHSGSVNAIGNESKWPMTQSVFDESKSETLYSERNASAHQLSELMGEDTEHNDSETVEWHVKTTVSELTDDILDSERHPSTEGMNSSIDSDLTQPSESSSEEDEFEIFLKIGKCSNSFPYIHVQ